MVVDVDDPNTWPPDVPDLDLPVRSVSGRVMLRRCSSAWLLYCTAVFRRTYIGLVDEAEASGQAWRDRVRSRPTAEQDRDALARLVEWDADPFETELYQRAADPQVISIDRAQRSRAGQYARRVRRLRDRKKHRDR